MATSALASIAIVAVGIDVAFHTNPQFRQVIQSQIGGPGAPSDTWTDTSTRLPPSKPERPVQPMLPPQPDDPFVLTAETINALVAYRNDPSPARRQDLLAALARAGAPPIETDRVRAIALQPPLIERLTQPGPGLPTRITARLSITGELAIAIAQ